jgi:hypothetical protein
MRHLQEIVGCPLYVLADLMAMGGTPGKRPQNEHVQRTWKQTRSLLFLLLMVDRLPQLTEADSRQSTMDCQVSTPANELA